VKAAIYLHEISPSESCLAALALFELGRLEDAVAFFIHGALNRPRSAKVLAGRRVSSPQSREEWLDQHEGESLRENLGGFFARQTARSKRATEPSGLLEG
jgi:hypothetical protein